MLMMDDTLHFYRHNRINDFLVFSIANFGASMIPLTQSPIRMDHQNFRFSCQTSLSHQTDFKISPLWTVVTTAQCFFVSWLSFSVFDFGISVFTFVLL